MKHIISGALLAALSLQASASELGTYGDTWNIREQNLITVLKRNLQEHFAGQSQAEIEQSLRQKAEDEAMRPAPVEGLVTGRDTHTRLFDPSFTVTRDMADQNGRVFAHRGQKVNPFDIIPVFDDTLYFIDADDPRQVDWMKQQTPSTTQVHVILVNGNIKDSAAALGTRIWFDQDGSLIRKFGITQIPARVQQAPGKKLFTITEFGLPDR
ncbi:type-F conjugative transfer system protein TraW [Candidatus Pantoea multigeneris]|uniref:Type-F conjugative transfer system protein TraW n=1 Tax=Candidatus Pantoea multigeneris TaxID=2608357 RepID=A0ABX0RHY3_9GAMM|nr:type-F conjugative transfer system protein TraW [Pantoea multigeneris]NIF23921.1 type-F conjugative transfer system protein TraW [Pantoea multigeneris]